MTNKVSIISMNVQGMADRAKRRDVINFLKSKKYSICMLQDTHFSSQEEHFIRSTWGYETYFSNYNTQSRGVAIFINNNFDCNVNAIEKDNDGNLLILNCKICEKDITLVNLYGPNKDTPQFYDSILDRLSKYENSLYILAGDFNLVLNQEVDCQNYLHLNNPNARDEVHSIISELNLIDVWRENNIEKREYTWFRHNPIKKARLDFFLISDQLYTEVDCTKILPGYRTDHSLIYMCLEFGKFRKGRSYWKFNNSLLRDEAYIVKVKEVISETKRQYSTNIVENLDELNEIPAQDLIFNINEQLFFETLLMNIRGITI
jgi:exonuclease III